MRARLLASMIVVAAAPALLTGCVGCKPGGNADFDGGLADRVIGYDAGMDQALYTWAVEPTFDEAPQGGRPVDFAAGPGGRLAIGYYIEPEPPVSHLCEHNFGQATIYDAQVMLARYSGGTWSSEAVTTVHSAQAIATAYCGDSLYLAYMAGETTGTICGSSQLAIRTVSDSAIGGETILTPDSGTGDACRLMQNACNLGDTIGRYPDMTCLPDGRLLLAYQDPHFGFAQQTDIEGSDLEIFLSNPPLSGGSRECLDDSSGAGAWLDTFVGAGGSPAIVHYVQATHDFNSAGCLDHPPPEASYPWPRGIHLVVEEGDGTWLAGQVANDEIDAPLAGAYTDTDGYVLFYALGSQLSAYVSTDGETWRYEVVDPNGRNGASPSAAVDGQGRLLVAYGRCAANASSSCNAAQDGVWIAARVDGRWLRSQVVNDPDALDGAEIFLQIDPDTGYPVIAYRNTTSNRMMLARATPR